MGKYIVIWDNGHACGSLSGEYDTEQDAEYAGADWQLEMEACTPGHDGCYSYEVVVK